MKLPFGTDSFDNVIATSLINIVNDKSKAIEELSRSCKKGGKLTVLVPSAPYNEARLQSLRSSIIEESGSGFSGAAMEVWLKRAPKMKVSDLENLFKQSGLTEITTKEYLEGLVISTTAKKPH